MNWFRRLFRRKAKVWSVPYECSRVEPSPRPTFRSWSPQFYAISNRANPKAVWKVRLSEEGEAIMARMMQTVQTCVEKAA